MAVPMTTPAGASPQSVSMAISLTDRPLVNTAPAAARRLSALGGSGTSSLIGGTGRHRTDGLFMLVRVRRMRRALL